MKIHYRTARFAATSGAIAAFALTTLAASAAARITVNGSAVDVEPAPIVQAGRVFVPLRGVFEQLGASVVYDNGTIDANGSGRDISLRIGSTQATVDGRTELVDVAPFIVGATTFVPLRFISESLGDRVDWDEADQIAAIDTGGGSADYYSPGTASYVDTAPPPIPQYDQPAVVAQNDVWQPGYWAWGSYGYYWVPGTWLAAPQPGYVWTPGYWQGNNVGFHWTPGYWATAVGFYGGVDYGHGYFGNGYDGGRWQQNVFRYNTYVTHVDTTIVRNVYVDRTAYVDGESAHRTGYNGGRYGLTARPTAPQLAVARDRHIGMTQIQRSHARAAEGDRRLLATVNHDKPPVIAVARPLRTNVRPAGFTPVRASERVDSQAHVAPVRTVAKSPTETRRPIAVRPVSVRPITVARPPVVARPTTVTRPPVVARPPTLTRPADVARPVAGPVRVTRPHVAPPAPATARIAAPPARRAAPVAVREAAPVAARIPARVPVIHEPAPAERAAAPPETAPRRAPAVYAAPPRSAPASVPHPVVGPRRVTGPGAHRGPGRP